MKIIHTCTFLLIFFISISTAVASGIDNTVRQETTRPATIRLATTTSTENSGLLRYLLPEFERSSGYKVHVIAVGTGKALRMGKDGDVDVLLVHALEAENDFVNNNYGIKRYPVMYNDFVILGPANDPASIGQSETLQKAFLSISEKQVVFISRGDDSGTHKKEKKNLGFD